MKEIIIKQKYEKRPLTIDAQVSLLKIRGLKVENEEELKYYLKNLSYYHLSIYFKHYQENDLFYKGITFKRILNIYKFDNKLRFLLLELLERVEKSFKSRMVSILSVEENNSHWHLDEKLFNTQEDHAEIIKLITEEVNKSRELSVTHYKKTYSDPALPPIWVVLEIMSFGQCVHIFKALKKSYRNKIARSFKEDEKFITNWILCLSLLRNHCAHYSRLWSRKLTFIARMDHNLYKKYFDAKSNGLYNYLVILQILLKEINPTASWLEKLKENIAEFEINVKNMGCPENWKENLSEIINIK